MIRTDRRLLLLGLAAVLASSELLAQSQEPGPSSAARYNVVWDSPSKDYSGSMPLGNGDIGVNAWLEETWRQSWAEESLASR